MSADVNACSFVWGHLPTSRIFDRDNPTGEVHHPNMITLSYDDHDVTELKLWTSAEKE